MSKFFAPIHLEFFKKRSTAAFGECSGGGYTETIGAQKYETFTKTMLF
jgi:hypothetical protein